jgi:multidrug efflux system outer membrane protein
VVNVLWKIWRLAGTCVLVGCAMNPQPLSEQEVTGVLVEDKELIKQFREPLTRPIGLHEVMSRAVLHNLEHRVSRMEQAVALGSFELAKYDMLPQMNANYGYRSRNKFNASTSISVETGEQSLEPSTSSEKDHNVGDFSASWNLLDFGVSYYQAQQEADRYLISREARKRVLSTLLQQARMLYWRAWAAQSTRDKVQLVLAGANQAYSEISQVIENRQYTNILPNLRLKRQLFDLIRELESLSEELTQANIELAQIINVPTNTEIRLLGIEPGAELASIESLPVLPLLDEDPVQMEITALYNSTELAEEMYNVRIDQAETRKALLRLLPGVELSYDNGHDSNKYLVNNNWAEAGVEVSWNLLNLATTGQVLKNTDLREELGVQRRLAVNMAVVTKLNLSVYQYNISLRKLDQAREIKSIDSEIARHTANAAISSAASKVESVVTNAAALRTDLSLLQAYANAQSSYGAVLVALGLNPVPETYVDLQLHELTNLIAVYDKTWQDGNIPLAN